LITPRLIATLVCSLDQQQPAVVQSRYTSAVAARRALDRSTLGAVFDAAPRAESLAVVHDPTCAARSTGRTISRFQRPAFQPCRSSQAGTSSAARRLGRAGGRALQRERYHQPSDEYSPAFT